MLREQLYDHNHGQTTLGVLSWALPCPTKLGKVFRLIFDLIDKSGLSSAAMLSYLVHNGRKLKL